MIASIAKTGLAIKFEVGAFLELPKLNEFRLGTAGSTLGKVGSRIINKGAFLGLDLMYSIPYRDKK